MTGKRARGVVLGLGILLAGPAADDLYAAGKLNLKSDAAPLPRTAGQSHAPMISEVSPSVVSIFTEGTARQRATPFFDDPMLRRFFGDPPRSPQRMPVRNLGSGVIVTKDGYILTNGHVVEGADKVQVRLADGKREFTAAIVGTDPQTDVAVLKVEASNLPAITIGDSDQLEVGDIVFALGNPQRVGQSVSMGIISGLARTTGILGQGGYESFIQTDAAINRGNSGGPLVDVQGRLIGINQSILSSTGGSDGIGFAIPVNLVRNVMEQLVNSGAVQRGYIGVNIDSLTQDLARMFKIDDASGALVTDVAEGGPAENAGLQAGDVIVQFDGRVVQDSSSLRLMASQTAPGTKVKLRIVRDGKGIERTVTLGQLPSDVASLDPLGSPAATGSNGLEGVVLENLTQDLRSQMNLPARIEGALVTEVDPDSRAYEAGLRAGDVIVEVGRNSIRSAGEVNRLSREARGDQLLLRVWSQRGGSGGMRFLVVDLRKRP